MSCYHCSTEDEKEGFVLRENVGLRLKALEYWHCNETGLYSHNQSTGDISLKVVIGEPITAIGELMYLLEINVIHQIVSLWE